jgi:hypothetical protein
MAVLLAVDASQSRSTLPSEFATAVRFVTALRYAAVIVLLDSTYPEPENVVAFEVLAPNVFPLAVENEFALTPLYTEEPLFQLFAN